MGDRRENYKTLLAECQQDFKSFEDYLLKEDRHNDYITFITKVENGIEFKIGSRKFLLRHYVDSDLLRHIRHYKLYEICLNENDYGKLKVLEIEPFSLKIVSGGTSFINGKGESIFTFEHYLNLLTIDLKFI